MNQVYEQIEWHIPYLRRYAHAIARNPIAAEDLLQETLTRAMAKSELFRAGTNLGAWLSTIMHNLHISEVRRQGRLGPYICADDSSADVAVPPVQDWVAIARALDKAMQAIPNKQRALILLASVECMSYDEIATALDLPVGTVKSRISRGRAALRSAIDGVCKQRRTRAATRSLLPVQSRRMATAAPGLTEGPRRRRPTLPPCELSKDRVLE